LGLLQLLKNSKNLKSLVLHNFMDRYSLEDSLFTSLSMTKMKSSSAMLTHLDLSGSSVSVPCLLFFLKICGKNLNSLILQGCQQVRHCLSMVDKYCSVDNLRKLQVQTKTVGYSFEEVDEFLKSKSKLESLHICLYGAQNGNDKKRTDIERQQSEVDDKQNAVFTSFANSLISLTDLNLRIENSTQIGKVLNKIPSRKMNQLSLKFHNLDARAFDDIIENEMVENLRLVDLRCVKVSNGKVALIDLWNKCKRLEEVYLAGPMVDDEVIKALVARHSSSLFALGLNYTQVTHATISLVVQQVERLCFLNITNNQNISRPEHHLGALSIIAELDKLQVLSMSLRIDADETTAIPLRNCTNLFMLHTPTSLDILRKILPNVRVHANKPWRYYSDAF
jgi:hypothetical protein